MKSKKVIFGAVALIFVTVAVLFGGWAGSNLRSQFLIDGTDYSTLSVDEFTAWLPTISNSDLTTVINALTEDADAHNRSITKIYEEIGNADTSITQGNERMTTIESEITKREDEYRTANADHETLTNELATLKTELQKQADIITALTEEKTQAEEEVVRLTAKKTQAENELKSAEDEIYDIQLGQSALGVLAFVTLPAQILEANAALAQVTNERIAKGINIKKLEKELIPLVQTRDAAKLALTSLEEQKRNLTTQKTTLETQLKKENDVLKTIKPANTSNPAYKRQKDKVAAIGKQLQGINVLLDVKNKDGIPEKIKFATSDLATKETAVTKAEKTIKDAKVVLNNLGPVWEERTRRVNELNAQKESTTRQHNQNTQRKRVLENSLIDLKKKITDSSALLVAAEKIVTDTVKKIADAQKKLDDLNTLLSEKETKASEAKKLVEDAQTLLVEAKSELRRFKSNMEQMTSLVGRLQEAERKLADLKQKLERANNEQSRSERSNTGGATSFEQQIAELEALNAQREATISAIPEIIAQLERDLANALDAFNGTGDPAEQEVAQARINGIQSAIAQKQAEWPYLLSDIANTQVTINELRKQREEQFNGEKGVTQVTGGGGSGGTGTTTIGGMSDITFTATATWETGLDGATGTDGKTGLNGATGTTTSGSGWNNICGETCNSCTGGGFGLPSPNTSTESTCSFVCLAESGPVTCQACKSGYGKNDEGVCIKQVDCSGIPNSHSSNAAELAKYGGSCTCNKWFTPDGQTTDLSKACTCQNGTINGDECSCNSGYSASEGGWCEERQTCALQLHTIITLWGSERYYRPKCNSDQPALNEQFSPKPREFAYWTITWECKWGVKCSAECDYQSSEGYNVCNPDGAITR